MTAADLEELPADTLDESEFAPVHAHCGICYPVDKFPPGSEVPALCGAKKRVISGQPFFSNAPDNVCVVCMDEGVLMTHRKFHNLF